MISVASLLSIKGIKYLLFLYLLMGLLSKTKRAINDFGYFDYFLRSRLNDVILLSRRRKFGALASYVISGVISWSLYDYYLRFVASQRATSLVVSPVRDYEMVLDLSDPGLSKELLLFGTREDKPATIFEQQLEEICSETDDPIIVEAGANIGYYTILEANVTNDAKIIAIEPAPSNIELLRKNITHNNCESQVSIYQCAIGSENGSTELQLSNHSNLHQIKSDSELVRTARDTIDVPIYRLDNFITNQGIDPEDVTVIRMDIEGFEVEALKGMSKILAADGPTLIYIEMHNNLLKREDSEQVISHFQNNGFKITAVEYDVTSASPFDLTYDINSFEQLKDISQAYSLIVRKT